MVRKNYRKKNKTTAKRTPTEAKTLLLENARQRMSQRFNKPKKVDVTKPIHPKFQIIQKNQQAYSEQKSGQRARTTLALKTLFWHIGAAPKDLVSFIPNEIFKDYKKFITENTW